MDVKLIMGMINQQNRLVVLLLLTALLLPVSLYVNIILDTKIVYTHLYYLPITMAGLWYYKKAVYVALFLAFIHIGINVPQEGLANYGVIIRGIALCFIAYVVGALAELKDRHLTSLTKAQQEMAMLSGKILNAYEEERARLARELHDEIGQTLTVISLDLQYLQLKLASAEKPLQEKVASSIKLLEQTLNYVRNQIVALRPPSLDNIGLVEVVREMVRELSTRTGLDIKIKEKGFSQRLPADLETALYRCIQEALTNVVRHAGATRVELELLKKPGMLTAIIKDNGKGFDPARLNIFSKGLGLAGMWERVNLLGGELQIDAVPGKGVRISIAIPLHH